MNKYQKIFKKYKRLLAFCFRLLIFVGITIYNYPYILSYRSLISLCAAAIAYICIIKVRKGGVGLFHLFKWWFSEHLFRSLLFIIMLWQHILFIILIISQYIIPFVSIILSRYIIPEVVYFIMTSSNKLNINDTSALFGAVIGGLFSVIAVRITIKSTNKDLINERINKSTPKIVLTTNPQNIDRIIGKSSIEYNFSNSKKEGAHLIPVYITNIGGESFNIRLTEIKTQTKAIFNITTSSNNTITLDYVPILKKGDAIEIYLYVNYYGLDFEITYLDWFSNSYSQYHAAIAKYSNRLTCPDAFYPHTLPRYIVRTRKRGIWRTNKSLLISKLLKNSPFFKDSIVEKDYRMDGHIN